MPQSDEPSKTEQRTSGSATNLLTGVEPERTGGWRETIESFAIAEYPANANPTQAAIEGVR